jgi:hypothetical protein
MKKCLRKKQEVFAIDICKVLDESESSCKDPINVENFLANHQDIFPAELL